MAKQQEYENAVGSIFDFIFAQKKAGGTLKPSSMEGIHATDEFTRALIDLAMNPALAVNDQMIQAFNGSFGSEKLINFKVDGDTDIKVTVGDLGTFMSDPRSFVAKAFEASRADRQVGSITSGIPSALNAANTMMYGLTNGLAFGDSAALAISAFGDPPASGEGDTLRNLASASAMEVVADKSKREAAAKVMRAQFAKPVFSGTSFTGPGVVVSGSGISDMGAKMVDLYKKKDKKVGDVLEKGLADFSSLSDEEKTLFGKHHQVYQNNVQRWGKRSSKVSGDIRAGLKKEGFTDPEIASFLDSFGDRFNENLHRIGGNGYLFKDGNLTRFGYQRANGRAFEQKFKATGDPKYIRSAEIIKAQARLFGPDTAQALKNIDKDIDRIEGLLSSTSTYELTKLKKMRDKLANQVYRPGASRFNQDAGWRVMVLGKDSKGGVKHKREIGKIYKEMITAEAHALMSKGPLTPTDKRKLDELMRMSKNSFATYPLMDFNHVYGRMKFMKGMWDDAVAKGGFVPAMLGGSLWDKEFGPSNRLNKDFGHDVNVKWFNKQTGKWEDRNVTGTLVGRDDTPVYNQLTGLYYIMPGTVLKTFLWDGGGFAYGGVMAKRRLMRGLVKAISNDTAFAAAYKLEMGRDFNPMEFAKDYPKFMETLKGGPYDRYFKIFEKSQSTINRLVRLHKGFSVPSETWRKFAGFIKGKLGSSIGKVFKGLSKNEMWHGLVDGVIGGDIGIAQAIEKLINAALQKLGMAFGGPLGAIFTSLVVKTFTKAAMAIIQPLVELIFVGLAGALLIILMLMMWAWPSKTTKIAPHYGVYPDSATELLYAEPGALDGTTPYDGPIVVVPGQSCPMVPMNCTASPEWHQVNSTMDLALDATGGPLWVAPIDGVVTSVIKDQTFSTCIPGTFSPSGFNATGSSPVSIGDEVKFRGDDGTEYKIRHATAMVSAGTSVVQGRAIAQVNGSLRSSFCWTGAHLHLEVQDGSVNSEDWYNALGCGISCPPYTP